MFCRCWQAAGSSPRSEWQGFCAASVRLASLARDRLTPEVALFPEFRSRSQPCVILRRRLLALKDLCNLLALPVLPASP